jgi:hypothetical protein
MDVPVFGGSISMPTSTKRFSRAQKNARTRRPETREATQKVFIGDRLPNVKDQPRLRLAGSLRQQDA